MKRIRKGNPITVIWALTSDGAPIPVDEYGVQIIMSSANYRAEISPSDVEVGESALVIRISAEAQVLAGVYSLTARISNEAGVVATLDECNVFELVPRSCCGCTEDAGEVIIYLGDEIAPGMLNKSLTLSVNGEDYVYNGRGDVDVPGFFAPTSPGASGQVLSGGEAPSWTGSAQALASDTTASEEVKGMAREAIDAQEEISVEVKPTGNIVLKGLAGGDKEFMPATPSGHPLHDSFVLAGGVWTPYDQLPDRLKDDRSLANGGYWAYRVKQGGLEDITTEEFAKMYEWYSPGAFASGHSWDNKYSNESNLIRTNICALSIAINLNLTYAAWGQSKMEVFFPSNGASCYTNDISSAWRDCSNLKRIVGEITTRDCNTSVKVDKAFSGCYNLEFVKLKEISYSTSFQDCSKLLNVCILYMINNVRASATGVVLTLHPEAYARAQADPEIVAALEAHTNFTLASA